MCCMLRSRFMLLLLSKTFHADAKLSAVLQVENYACSLSNVYTFGPTFRAENSHTSRHLAEFWMIEPELAFANLEDNMQCAEDYVRFCCTWLLERCPCVNPPPLFPSSTEKCARLG